MGLIAFDFTLKTQQPTGGLKQHTWRLINEAMSSRIPREYYLDVPPHQPLPRPPTTTGHAAGPSEVQPRRYDSIQRQRNLRPQEEHSVGGQSTVDSAMDGEVCSNITGVEHDDEGNPIGAAASFIPAGRNAVSRMIRMSTEGADCALPILANDFAFLASIPFCRRWQK